MKTVTDAEKARVMTLKGLEEVLKGQDSFNHHFVFACLEEYSKRTRVIRKAIKGNADIRSEYPKKHFYR